MKQRTYEYNGNTYTTAELAEEFGIKKKTLEKRLRVNGYDVSKCITRPVNPNFKDLTGSRFGRWVVVSRAEDDSNKNTMWHCVCDCGNKAIVAGGSLKTKASQSCGCYNDEKNLVHGHAKKRGNSRTYATYKSMVQRCTNEEATGYEHYGARGITVCDRWLESFENFLEDMGERPIGRTLDRIDNDIGYSKDNCKWATNREQRQNTRVSRRWFLFGKKYNTALEAAEELNVSKSTIVKWCNGKKHKDVFYEPKKGCYSELVYQGGV